MQKGAFRRQKPQQEAGGGSRPEVRGFGTEAVAPAVSGPRTQHPVPTSKLSKCLRRVHTEVSTGPRLPYSSQRKGYIAFPCGETQFRAAGSNELGSGLLAFIALIACLLVSGMDGVSCPSCRGAAESE